MTWSKTSAVSGLLVAGALWASARAADPTAVASPPVHSVAADPATLSLGSDGASAICDVSGKEEPPQDLTLWNFCSAGWDEEFTRRRSEGRAPDMALLRVQTNFMERELRVNYFHQHNINSARRENLDDFDVLIAYGLNRRFMIEIVGIQQ